MLSSNKKILFYLLGWRALLFGIAASAPLILGFAPTFPYSERLLATGLPSWIVSFAHFDGVHYLGIAETVYGAYFTQAFFPLYPLVVWLVQHLFFFLTDSWTRLILSGLLVSHVAFLTATLLYIRLYRLEFPTLLVGRPLVAMLLFPTAFYFGSVYSESLFLALVLGSFLLMRKKHFFSAAVLVGFATATRLVGMALVPALAIEYFLAHRKVWASVHTVWLTILVGIACTGIIAYSLFLGHRFGDPLLFAHVQGAFGAERTTGSFVSLPQVFYRYIKILTTVPLASYSFFVAALEFCMMVLGLLGLLAAFRLRIRSSYLVFSAIAILLPTLTGTFTSIGRYLLPAFPLYWVIAMLPLRIWRVWAVVSGIALVLFTALFASGRWIA